ncbi:helix-turn-helix domain-containing protein [Phaeobacter sp.]|uniref:helix-turn-helix domain-containing protein n=1 Tax=Phaeobacter sp. TaxID=1902409 RepID=UPI0025F1BC60|nr:helix-turn-helix domain-containing protein [Phaeobacter sp.]
MPRSGHLNPARHFRNISSLARFIDESHDADETYQLLTQGVCQHSQWDLSSIQVLDLEAGLAIPIVRHDPFNPSDLAGFPGWDARLSPVGKVLENGEPLILRDAAAQDEFPGFQADAIRRKYHTTVIIPLEVRDVHRRQMVYSVASRQLVDVDETDLSFLQCVAELATIAVRKMRKLEQQQKQAQRLRAILEHMTASLTKTLDTEAAGTLAVGLSSLFPAGWLAVDLTSGRGLFDPDVPPPVALASPRRMPEELIAAALAARGLASGTEMDLTVAGNALRAEVSPLQIDGSHVGALFFFLDAPLSDHERIAAQAGRLALSSFILRSFIDFKSCRVTARRLMSRLFSGHWQDREELLDEAHRLDFDLDAPLRLLMLRVPQTDPTEGVDDGVHSFILRTAQLLFGPAVSCLLDGNLILLLDDSSSAAETKQAMFLSRVRSLLPPQTGLVMSAQVQKIEQLKKAKETCEATLDVAQSMSASGWVTPVNVGEFPALMASAEMPKVEAFLQNVLPEALTAPARKAEVALRTIETFLDTGRRYQEAADRLDIHVSTLRYRLEQLSHQHGLNFDDSDKCFELDLAIRLHRLRFSYGT